MTPRAPIRTLWPWLGPVLLGGFGAAIAALKLHAPMNRGLWESGALYFALSYERTLPMVGLGCALGQVGQRWALVGALVFVAALAAGLPAEARLVAMTSHSQALWIWLLVAAGPLGCVVAGIALAVPRRGRVAVVLPVAAALGFQFGVAVRLQGPGLDDGEFTGAAIIAALWLIAGLNSTWRRMERPWLRVGGRILGSWLIAIGLMLSGATLAPRHSPSVAAPPLPPPTDEFSTPPGRRYAFPESEAPRPSPLDPGIQP